MIGHLVRKYIFDDPVLIAGLEENERARIFVLSVDKLRDPGTAGKFLADLAVHTASAMELNGQSPSQAVALDELRTAMEIELNHPSATYTGEMGT